MVPTLGRSVGLLVERPSRWEREHPRWPSYATVRRYHGDWNAALAAAGLSAPRAPLLALAERVAAAQRLAAEGQRTATIAEILGVHITTARGYLTAGRCPACGGVKIREQARTCRACRQRHAWWPPFTDEQLLERIAAWNARFGRPPTKRRWRPVELGGHPVWEAEHPAWPAPSLVLRRFGTWHAALAAAGVAPATWTPAEMVCALRRFHAETGRAPSARELPRATSEYPSASMVSDAFGSWHQGLLSAGLMPRRRARWTTAELIDASATSPSASAVRRQHATSSATTRPSPPAPRSGVHFGSIPRALEEAAKPHAHATSAAPADRAV